MVRKEFSAKHYLIGGDWGKENKPHFHNYTLELELSGHNLDENNFLADIVPVESVLASVMKGYKNHLLNELPEFDGKNPSLELFSQVLCERFCRDFTSPFVDSITVRLWESRKAWSSYTRNCQ